MLGKFLGNILFPFINVNDAQPLGLFVLQDIGGSLVQVRQIIPLGKITECGETLRSRCRKRQRNIRERYAPSSGRAWQLRIQKTRHAFHHLAWEPSCSFGAGPDRGLSLPQMAVERQTPSFFWTERLAPVGAGNSSRSLIRSDLPPPTKSHDSAGSCPPSSEISIARLLPAYTVDNICNISAFEHLFNGVRKGGVELLLRPFFRKKDVIKGHTALRCYFMKNFTL